MRNQYPDSKEIVAVCINAKQLDESHSSDPNALKDCIATIQDQFVRMNLYQKGFISIANAYLFSIAIRKLYIHSVATQNNEAQKAIEDLLVMRFGRDETSPDYFNASLFEVLFTTMGNEDLFETELCRALVKTLKERVNAEKDRDSKHYANRHHSFPKPTLPSKNPEQNTKQPYYRSASPVKQKSLQKLKNPVTPTFRYYFPDFPTPIISPSSSSSSLEANSLGETPCL